MAQTPRAGTGDSVGQFRRYQWSTLFNYDSNLSMCGTFLQKLIHLPDNRGLPPTPKETYDLNLNAVTLSLVISNPNIFFWHQKFVQSWFASICFSVPPSPPLGSINRPRYLRTWSVPMCQLRSAVRFVPGVSGSPYFNTPFVCVLNGLGGLAVRRFTNEQPKTQ